MERKNFEKLNKKNNLEEEARKLAFKKLMVHKMVDSMNQFFAFMNFENAEEVKKICETYEFKKAEEYLVGFKEEYFKEINQEISEFNDFIKKIKNPDLKDDEFEVIKESICAFNGKLNNEENEINEKLMSL